VDRTPSATPRLAPADAKLQQVLNAAALELDRFAAAEGTAASQRASAAAGSAETAPPAITLPAPQGSVVYRRLRWELPPASAFSAKGRAQRETLSDVAHMESLWSWINGRRTVQKIIERAGLPIPAADALAYLAWLPQRASRPKYPPR
jgi:hypothetical protein